jgi:hypothetical protein
MLLLAQTEPLLLENACRSIKGLHEIYMIESSHAGRKEGRHKSQNKES